MKGKTNSNKHPIKLCIHILCGPCHYSQLQRTPYSTVQKYGQSVFTPFPYTLYLLHVTNFHASSFVRLIDYMKIHGGEKYGVKPNCACTVLIYGDGCTTLLERRMDTRHCASATTGLLCGYGSGSAGVGQLSFGKAQ